MKLTVLLSLPNPHRILLIAFVRLNSFRSIKSTFPVTLNLLQNSNSLPRFNRCFWHVVDVGCLEAGLDVVNVVSPTQFVLGVLTSVLMLAIVVIITFHWPIFIRSVHRTCTNSICHKQKVFHLFDGFLSTCTIQSLQKSVGNKNGKFSIERTSCICCGDYSNVYQAILLAKERLVDVVYSS